ncbi:hypothetical protein LTR15_002472 [Elasticomyces elasticus]|nr:hypothetical protein LTR15_002472 [Elasticomyces elasticus]
MPTNLLDLPNELLLHILTECIPAGLKIPDELETPDCSPSSVTGAAHRSWKSSTMSINKRLREIATDASNRHYTHNVLILYIGDRTKYDRGLALHHKDIRKMHLPTPMRAAYPVRDLRDGSQFRRYQNWAVEYGRGVDAAVWDDKAEGEGLHAAAYSIRKAEIEYSRFQLSTLVNRRYRALILDAFFTHHTSLDDDINAVYRYGRDLIRYKRDAGLTESDVLRLVPLMPVFQVLRPGIYQAVEDIPAFVRGLEVLQELLE